MGINFNINKEGVKEIRNWFSSVFKNIRKRDVIFFFFALVITYGLFQDKIDKLIFDDYKVFTKKESENKVKKDSIIGPLVRRDIFGEYLDEDPLDDILQELCDKYKCSYTNVNLFHNGLITESGYHCKKMSAVAEGVERGRLPKIHMLQSWVIKPFKEKFKELKNTGYKYIPNLLKDEDPYFSVTIPKFGGMHSVYYVALYDERYIDKHGRPHFVGYLSYIWEDSTSIDTRQLEAMRREVERIKEFVIDEKKKD